MLNSLNGYLVAAALGGLTLAPLGCLAALIHFKRSGDRRFLPGAHLLAAFGTGVWILISYWHIWTDRFWPLLPLAAAFFITLACGWHARPERRGWMLAEGIGLFLGANILMNIIYGAFAPLAQRTYAQGRAKKAFPSLRSLGKDESAVSALVEALEHRDRNVRWGAAIEARYRAPHSPPVAQALARRLVDLDGEVRHSAQRALDRMDPIPEEALPELLGSVDQTLHESSSGSYDPCPSANSLLVKVGEPAVPALISRLDSDDLQKRTCAIHALGDLGPKSKPAVPELKALQARSPADAPAVQRTLRRIGSDRQR